MAIKWNKNLETGIITIDNQHKKLFEEADKLFEAGKTGKSKEHIIELLKFLDSYTKTHFRDEERYMTSIGYPALNEQKGMHKAFINKLTDLRKDYETSGANISVIINANQFVLDWLTKHISIQDKKIGEFARKNGK